MNKKGQALVEFIIIIPILIIILIGLSDYIMIFNTKNNLEKNIDEVVKIYNKYHDEEEILNYLNNTNSSVTYQKTKNGKYTKIELQKEYSFITPGLDKIISSPFIIKTERVILDE